MQEIKHDAFGPEYVIDVYDPELDMRGVLVIDNTVRGPGKGGLRMTSAVTAEEVFRLARTMTWKNALAELPFGGAKSGIVWPEDAEARAKKHGGLAAMKKKYVQSFARALKPLMPRYYITAPDVNVGEQEMAWFVDATGNWKSATGKPATLCMKIFGKEGERCGLPHEYGSTGFGVARATRVAMELLGRELRGATVSIHGFGNVGTFAYKFLSEMGAKIIAIADRTHAFSAPRGFESAALNKIIEARGRLADYHGAEAITPEDFWKIPVDVLIPASVTDVITDLNKRSVKAKVIVEAANIPMKESIEREFSEQGVLIVPDFVANAGGVISSYAEYRGYNPKRMFDLIERKIEKTTRKVLKQALSERRNPRDIALEIARANVESRTKRNG